MIVVLLNNQVIYNQSVFLQISDILPKLLSGHLLCQGALQCLRICTISIRDGSVANASFATVDLMSFTA